MSVTPIQGAAAVDPAKPASRRPRDEEFATIFANYTSAMVAGGPSAAADPRDRVEKESSARDKRIESEVAEMRQAELDRASGTDRDAAGKDARFDADALRRQARLESDDSRAVEVPANLRQSNPVQQPQPAQEFATRKDSARAVHDLALRSEAAGDEGSKNRAQSGATESAGRMKSEVAETARSNVSATPTRPAIQPVAVSASNADSSRTDAARSIARMLARDFGGAAGRDPSLQPAVVNRDPQSGHQPRSEQSQAGSANKPDTPARTDEEASTRRTEFAKLMRNVRLNVGQRQSSATIQMNPPQLGRLRIDVRMTDQRLSVHVETQTIEGRALMTERAGELIDALRAGGIEVEQFEIIAAVQRAGLMTAKADIPRDPIDGSPQAKRSTRRGDESGAERNDTGTRNEGHDRGGLSLRA